jgi:hypothetical protein
VKYQREYLEVREFPTLELRQALSMCNFWWAVKYPSEYFGFLQRVMCPATLHSLFCCPGRPEVQSHSTNQPCSPVRCSGAHKLRSHSVISQHDTQPVGSLPYSQELSTFPYPEADQSTLPQPLSAKSILILLTHLSFVLPSCFFPFYLSTNKLY